MVAPKFESRHIHGWFDPKCQQLEDDETYALVIGCRVLRVSRANVK
jgi:hypothetical protein